MRKLVLLLAILALPGLAMAQPNLDASSGGLLAISVAPNAPIVIDVDLGPATTCAQAMQYNLTVDGGANDALATVAAFTDTSPGTLLGVGGFVGFGFFPPVNLGAVNPVAEGLLALAPNAPGTPIAQWTLTIAAPGVYLVQADTMMNASNGIDGIAFAGAGTAVQVTVTPEPATALLLLGALPFLRRRR